MVRRIICLGIMVMATNAAWSQYFQQHVAYQIRVKLDDERMLLHAEEEIVYTNNSPDTLEYLMFHLWPNAYRNNETALAKQLIRMKNTSLIFADEDERGYIDSLEFKLNAQDCEWKLDPEHIDICRIELNEPLAPGDQVTITTPFRVKIPSGRISRLGHIGESFQITQWYPKPAVYDTAGWHAMPYLTQGEFFSEFGSYDVFVELPSNYVVGATGDLQTLEEQEWLNKKVVETEAWIEKRKEAVDWQDWTSKLDFPESDTSFKTLHYHQEKVHDFAWFADKRYHVLRGKVTTPATRDSVVLWTMFTNKNAKFWAESIEYMRDAVYYYSLWNGDYPYRQATAVDGTISAGGGMEYPNVTVIGNVAGPLTLETVIMHEVGHNWFYGILGSNERRFPWLDEGINSYNEQRYLSTKYPNGVMLSRDGPNGLTSFLGLNSYGLEDQHELTYLLMARINQDQPMDLPADQYSMINYGAMVYAKSAVTLNHLRHYLGDSIMDAGMHRYFEEYKFKHPSPESFESAIVAEAGEDLDWFFHDVVSSKDKIDYKISKVRSGDETTVTLKNRGLKVPVHVALVDKEGEIIEEKWVKGFEKDSTIAFQQTGNKVIIDPDDVMPELIRDNNYARTKGVLKRVEPIKFKAIGGAEQPGENQINLLPILGMNVPNGFMPGLMVYNHTIPARKFTYVFMPMLATKGMEPVGTGLLSYSIQPRASIFENIEVTLSGKRYLEDRTSGMVHRYSRLFPHATFYLRPNDYAGLWSQNFTLGSVINYTEYPALAGNTWSKQDSLTYYNRIQYKLEYDHPVYETSWQVNLEHHRAYLRTSLEFWEHFDYDKKVRLDLRVFAGAFLMNNTTNPAFNWRMDGQSASRDYAYDGEFFDRSGGDDFLARQFMENHGAFKVPTAVGQSSRWISAMNLKARFGKIPVGVFADIGTSYTEPFMFDAGIYAALYPNVIEVYVPLVYSSNIQEEISANGLEWHELFRFQIGLEELNLFETIKRLKVL